MRSSVIKLLVKKIALILFFTSGLFLSLHCGETEGELAQGTGLAQEETNSTSDEAESTETESTETEKAMGTGTGVSTETDTIPPEPEPGVMLEMLPS